MGLHRGRTQHMSLSAADAKTRCSKPHVVHKRIVPIMKCDCICTRRTAQVPEHVYYSSTYHGRMGYRLSAWGRIQ